MKFFTLIAILSIFVFSCGEKQQAESRHTGGLQKISNPTKTQIQQLKDAGADIIVQESDYIVIRTDNMTEPMAFSSNPIQEQDLKQRLIHVYVPDTTALQTVINSGVDFWQVDGDTAIARAFDLYINNLKAAGLDVRIVAQDANVWMEGLK
jgi:hypothetical protein